ncbi:MAG: DUF4381 domain-containing protein [Gammaproteobacteria bacterium]|nr:DUF4381 domain-containing protein [Gammaproteobacteria bacterium]
MSINPASINDGLRDIHGLDPAPWWPPGPGWWLVAAGVVAVVALVLLLRRRRSHQREQWRRDALARLRRLERRLPNLTRHDAAGELVQLLRRVAMVRYGRHQAAGLWGDEWLAWLERHDPRGFPWRSRGAVLVSSPYAPPDPEDGRALAELVAAARHWVRREPDNATEGRA